VDLVDLELLLILAQVPVVQEDQVAVALDSVIDPAAQQNNQLPRLVDLVVQVELRITGLQAAAAQGQLVAVLILV
jgi:hypothetical protein